MISLVYPANCFLEDQSRNKIAKDSSGYLYTVSNHYNGTSFTDIVISRSTDGGSSWTNYTLYYSAGNWPNYCPSIAIDSSDNIFVVWETVMPTVHSYHNNISLIKGKWGAWGAREDVTDSANNQYVPSVAIDASDNLHITYYGLGHGVNTTYYQICYRERFANNSYGTETVLTDVAGHQSDSTHGSPSICLDGNGVIHIIWSGLGWGTYPTYYQVNHIQYSSGTWQSAESLTNINSINSIWPVMAIDSSNNLHAVYYDSVNSLIKYQKKISSWGSATTIIGDGTYLSYNPCIALDSSDNIYVSAESVGYQSSTIRSIVLNKYTSSAWQGVQVISNLSTQQQHACLLWAKYPSANILTNDYNLVWLNSGSTNLEYSGGIDFGNSVSTSTVNSNFFLFM